jgi:hypothetical protein
MLGLIMLIAAAQAADVPKATSVPAAAPAAVAPGDKMRCKRYTATGTLSHVVKECHTVSEWHALDENARRNVTQYMDDPSHTARGGPQ